MKVFKRKREEVRDWGLAEYGVQFSKEDRGILMETIRLSAVVSRERAKRLRKLADEGTELEIVCAADVKEVTLAGEKELREFLMSLPPEKVGMLLVAMEIGRNLYWYGFRVSVDELAQGSLRGYRDPEESGKEGEVNYLMGKLPLTVYLQLALIKLNL